MKKNLDDNDYNIASQPARTTIQPPTQLDKQDAKIHY